MLKVYIVLFNLFILSFVHSLENKKIIVTVDNLFFRTGPSLESSIITKLKCGEILDYLS